MAGACGGTNNLRTRTPNLASPFWLVFYLLLLLRDDNIAAIDYYR